MEISMLLDSSVHQQVYIEDCENCCNPMEVHCTFNSSELIDFEVRSLEQ